MTFPNASLKPKHEASVLTDLGKRQITLTCICGWSTRLSNENSANSKYADADAWASHFELTLD